MLGAIPFTKLEIHHACPSSNSYIALVRDTTLLVALLDALDERSRDVILESVEVGWCDLFWEAQGSKDDIRVGVLEEAVGSGNGARVFVAESSDGSDWVALLILLPVHGAFGEDEGLELGEFFAYLSCEGVVKDESGKKRSFCGDSEDFGGSVRVGRVEAAGLVEQTCNSDVERGQGGKVLSVGSNDFTTRTRCAWVGCRVQVELEIGSSVALGIIEQRDPIWPRSGCDKVGDKLGIGRWVRGGGRNAEDTGGCGSRCRDCRSRRTVLCNWFGVD